MITIPKKVEYSVVLISYLAKNNGKTIALADAAKELSLPYRFLGQLAGALRVAGIIDSKEGKSGGYFLVTGWESKNIYDLLEALGENKHLVKCLSDDRSCARLGRCQFTDVWQKVENSMTRELKSIKLKSLN
jgi:Rrf2 family protein